MTVDPARFGTDLRLLASADATHSNRDGGYDLQLRPGPGGTDLATLTGIDALTQALVLRLLTTVGELAGLGHPDYGSRLAELIGELNTATNRNRLKVYTLQALSAEPRVVKVLALNVTTSLTDRSRVEITAQLDAGDSKLSLVIPFTFEGGAA
jgi:phage baseplate assembly protein W